MEGLAPFALTRRIKQLNFFFTFLYIIIIVSLLLTIKLKTEKLFFETGFVKNIEFQDLFFRKNLEMFKKYHYRNGTRIMNKNFSEHKIPSFLLLSTIRSKSYWDAQMHHITHNECPLPCKYTRELTNLNKVDALVIHLDSFKNPKAVLNNIHKRRNPNHPWVMLSFETCLMANKTFKLRYKDFDSFFNRTMSFRKNSDVILNHGFIVSKNDSTLLPHHWSIPLDNINPVTYKPNATVIATLISNCKDKSGRLKYIKELSQYINVDIFGKCGKLKCGGSLYVNARYKPNNQECLKKVGTSYMFYLAFENSFCKDYITEKVYNLLYYPIVPIVYGGANYEEFLPPNSYINAAIYSPVKLAEYIKFLLSNQTEYRKYLKWREFYSPSTVGGERILCDLCTTLHNPDFYKHNVIENFDKWFVEDSKCFRYI
ncbi:UNVERIFIED_CONTAM: hypothetical protein RMT77_010853 [Armadillidium vulgare]